MFLTSRQVKALSSQSQVNMSKWWNGFIPETATRSVLQKHLCQKIKKETLTLVFSCEFCEIIKNTYFEERLFFKEEEGWRGVYNWL